VRAGTIEEIRPDQRERYSATMAAAEEIRLAFKSAGLIERVHQVRGADGRVRDVQAGDKVSQGTELAAVRRLDYEQRLQQAQEQVRQSEAQLSQGEAGLAQAEQDYKRAGNLYRTASLTKPDYDQAKARYDSAKAEVEGAKAAISNARVVVGESDLAILR
jgi:multidrug resistance efflux pump